MSEEEEKDTRSAVPDGFIVPDGYLSTSEYDFSEGGDDLNSEEKHDHAARRQQEYRERVKLAKLNHLSQLETNQVFANVPQLSQ